MAEKRTAPAVPAFTPEMAHVVGRFAPTRVSAAAPTLVAVRVPRSICTGVAKAAKDNVFAPAAPSSRPATPAPFATAKVSGPVPPVRSSIPLNVPCRVPAFDPEIQHSLHTDSRRTAVRSRSTDNLDVGQQAVEPSSRASRRKASGRPTTRFRIASGIFSASRSRLSSSAKRLLRTCLDRLKGIQSFSKFCRVQPDTCNKIYCFSQ